MKLKQTLLQWCIDFVNNRLQTIQNTMLSHQKSLQSETKSSAGDKHETGRAMVQLEMEKAGLQLNGILEMKTVLAKIEHSKLSGIICLGSVIITDKNNYFLSVSAGKITIFDTDYFAISSNSPVGKLLLGKKVNDVVSWNGVTMNIQKIL